MGNSLRLSLLIGVTVFQSFHTDLAFAQKPEDPRGAKQRIYQCNVTVYAIYNASPQKGVLEQKIIDRSFEGKVDSLNSPILHDEYFSLYDESHRLRFVVNPLGMTGFPGDPTLEETTWYYLFNQTAKAILAEGRFSVRKGKRLPSDFALQDFFFLPNSSKQHLVRLVCTLG